MTGEYCPTVKNAARTREELQASEALDTAGFEDMAGIVAVMEMNGYKNPVVLELVNAGRRGIYDGIKAKTESPEIITKEE